MVCRIVIFVLHSTRSVGVVFRIATCTQCSALRGRYLSERLDRRTIDYPKDSMPTLYSKFMAYLSGNTRHAEPLTDASSVTDGCRARQRDRPFLSTKGSNSTVRNKASSRFILDRRANFCLTETYCSLPNKS